MTVKIRTEHTKQWKWKTFYTKISVSVVEGGLNLGTICGCVLSRFSHVRLFATLWTAAPSGSFVHGILQERKWSGLPYSPAGDLPHPGIKPGSPALQADFFTVCTTREAILPPGNICRTVKIILRSLSLC